MTPHTLTGKVSVPATMRRMVDFLFRLHRSMLFYHLFNFGFSVTDNFIVPNRYPNLLNVQVPTGDGLSGIVCACPAFPSPHSFDIVINLLHG
jgi:hypothetical protein